MLFHLNTLERQEEAVVCVCVCVCVCVSVCVSVFVCKCVLEQKVLQTEASVCLLRAPMHDPQARLPMGVTTCK